MGSISWAKRVLIRVAEAVLSSMDLRANAALVALRSMTLLRSALVSERQRLWYRRGRGLGNKVGVILEDVFGQRDIHFGGVGSTVEYSITGFGYVDFEAVIMAVLYCGVYRVADTGSCGGEIADGTGRSWRWGVNSCSGMQI